MFARIKESFTGVEPQELTLPQGALVQCVGNDVTDTNGWKLVYAVAFQALGFVPETYLDSLLSLEGNEATVVPIDEQHATKHGDESSTDQHSSLFIDTAAQHTPVTSLFTPSVYSTTTVNSPVSRSQPTLNTQPPSQQQQHTDSKHHDTVSVTANSDEKAMETSVPLTVPQLNTGSQHVGKVFGKPTHLPKQSSPLARQHKTNSPSSTGTQTIQSPVSRTSNSKLDVSGVELSEALLTQSSQQPPHTDTREDDDGHSDGAVDGNSDHDDDVITNVSVSDGSEEGDGLGDGDDEDRLVESLLNAVVSTSTSTSTLPLVMESPTTPRTPDVTTTQSSQVISTAETKSDVNLPKRPPPRKPMDSNSSNSSSNSVTMTSYGFDSPLTRLFANHA